MRVTNKNVTHRELFPTAFSLLIFLMFSSCGFFAANSTQRTEESVLTSEVAKVEPALYLDLDFENQYPADVTYFIPSLVPVEAAQPALSASRQAVEQAVRVAPELTPWGEPWNHRDICTRMDAILFDCGIDSFQARVRMIAHAVVASGWRQNVWNFNAWGVQLGSWDGPWFIMSTDEVDENGQVYTVWQAAWRSFSSWKEAVDDYQARISSESTRDSYRTASTYLYDADPWADISFWLALKEGRYYTNHGFTSRKFAALCRRVRQELLAYYADSREVSIYSRKI